MSEPEKSKDTVYVCARLGQEEPVLVVGQSEKSICRAAALAVAWYGVVGAWDGGGHLCAWGVCEGEEVGTAQQVELEPEWDKEGIHAAEGN